MNNKKRNLAFYKRSGKPWTEEEYRNIMKHVGDNDKGDWYVHSYYEDANRKYIFDGDYSASFMYFWEAQERNPNFPNCQQIAYEDVFGNNPSQECTPEIPEGTIVTATREKDGFTRQARYFGTCNGKHVVDFNGTHAMIVDAVEVVHTMTKKEAKQRVSELFADKSKVTSQMIRDIIDLIEE